MTESEIDAILNVARNWIGYLEKREPKYSFYEHNTANTGKKNYTRFGRIYDLITNGVDKRKLDGQFWCAMFVVACIYESKAGQIDTTQPIGSLEVRQDVVEWMKKELSFGGSISGLAACETWKNNFMKHRRVDNKPTKGSFVVFLDKTGHAYHIGIVESVGSNGEYTTIEGNTGGNGGGVIPNGGSVKRLKRNVSKQSAVFLHVIPGETTDIPNAVYEYSSGAGYGNELTINYGGSSSYSPNKVTKLSNARNRQKNSDPNVSENRKNDFSSLADRLIDEAPHLGREINKSQEMYGSEILKGTQVSKKRIR